MAAALCIAGAANGQMKPLGGAEPIICNCLLTNLSFGFLSRRAYPDGENLTAGARRGNLMSAEEQPKSIHSAYNTETLSVVGKKPSIGRLNRFLHSRAAAIEDLVALL